MGGGNSPLYKEPFVTMMGNDDVGYFAAYVSGGSVRLLKGYEQEDGTSEPYVWYKRDLGDDLSYFPLSSVGAAAISYFNDLETLYGIIVGYGSVDTSLLLVNGKEFSYSDISYLENESLFNRAGLCEGVVQILDEEGDSLIASGVWSNGQLYLFELQGDDGRAYAATAVSLYFQSEGYTSFADTLKEANIYWGASLEGFDKEAVEQLITSRGLNVVWISNALDDLNTIDGITLYSRVSETNIYK